MQGKPANSLRNSQTEQINKVKLKSQQDADLLEDLRSVVYLVIISYVFTLCVNYVCYNAGITRDSLLWLFRSFSQQRAAIEKEYGQALVKLSQQYLSKKNLAELKPEDKKEYKLVRMNCLSKFVMSRLSCAYCLTRIPMLILKHFDFIRCKALDLEGTVPLVQAFAWLYIWFMRMLFISV